MMLRSRKCIRILFLMAVTVSATLLLATIIDSGDKEIQNEAIQFTNPRGIRFKNTPPVPKAMDTLLQNGTQLHEEIEDIKRRSLAILQRPMFNNSEHFKALQQKTSSDLKLIDILLKDIAKGEVQIKNGHIARSKTISAVKPKRPGVRSHMQGQFGNKLSQNLRGVVRASQNKLNKAGKILESPGTHHCRPLHFSREKLPLVALASYQGSGNTWLRHLIQEVTGLYTGSPYHDPVLQTGGFPGEGRTKGDVVITKTHGGPTSDRLNYKKAILLIRNPYEAILADFNRHNRLMGNTHTDLAPESLFLGDDWPNHVAITSSNWFHFYNTWLDHPGIDILLLVYSDLKKNLIFNMRRVVNFLNVSATEEHFTCLLNNTEGNFHRKKKTKQPAHYSENAVNLISVQTKIINEKLLKRFKMTVDSDIP